MNKKVIIVLVVAVLGLVVLGGAFVAYKIAKKAKNEMSNVVKQVVQEVTKKQSLKDLIMAGGNVSCTFATGKTYVSGKMVRADFTSGHMIQDGTYAYMWSDGQATGTKIKIDAMMAAAQKAATQSPTMPAPTSTPTTGVDQNQQMDMNCTAWTPDASMFVPPTTVQFTDLSAMMKNVPAVNSSMCDAVSDPTAKAACLSAIK